MVTIKIDGKTWYESKTFLKNLDIWLDGMEENDDLVLVVDGLERSGKSKRIRQIARYCANRLGSTFGPDNVHFELKSYIDFSITSPKYTVCVLDEGRNVLNKKNSISKINKKFTNYLSECAKKRQVHIIALPAYHDLDSYVTLWRMKGVVHLHKWYEADSTKQSGYKLARGQYTVYLNNQYLKNMYKYPYLYPKKHECKGRYDNLEVFTESELEEYENKKDTNLEQKYHSKYEEERIGQQEKRWRSRWVNQTLHFMNARGITMGEIADASHMEVKNVRIALVRNKPTNTNTIT